MRATRRTRGVHRLRPETWEPLEARALLSGSGQLQIENSPYAVAQYPIGGLGQQLRVAVDGGDAGYDGDVTVALAGTNPGTLSGTLTVAAVNGVATFTDLTFGAAGNYTLTATDAAGDSMAPPAEVTGVLPATTRCEVVLLTQPTLDAATGTFGFTVGIEDAVGDLMHNSASDSALPPELQIQTGPAGAVLYGSSSDTLLPSGAGPGGVVATLNPDGTATFSGLKVTAAGTYTFQVLDATPVSFNLTASIDLPASGPPPTPPATPAPAPMLTAGPPSGVIMFVSPPAGTATATLTQAEKLADAKAAKAEKLTSAKAAKANRDLAASEAKAAHAALVAERPDRQRRGQAGKEGQTRTGARIAAGRLLVHRPRRNLRPRPPPP
jgi:hypothetical protein